MTFKPKNGIIRLVKPESPNDLYIPYDKPYFTFGRSAARNVNGLVFGIVHLDSKVVKKEGKLVYPDVALNYINKYPVHEKNCIRFSLTFK